MQSEEKMRGQRSDEVREGVPAGKPGNLDENLGPCHLPEPMRYCGPPSLGLDRCAWLSRLFRVKWFLASTLCQQTELVCMARTELSLENQSKYFK